MRDGLGQCTALGSAGCVKYSLASGQWLSMVSAKNVAFVSCVLHRSCLRHTQALPTHP